MPGAACGVLLGDDDPGRDLGRRQRRDRGTGRARRPCSSSGRSPRCTRPRWSCRRSRPGSCRWTSRCGPSSRSSWSPTPGPPSRSRPATCSPTPAASRATTSSTPGGTPTPSPATSPRWPGLGQIHPTDEAYSFCNTGYGVPAACSRWPPATHFDRVLRRRLTRPLGLPGDAHAAPARAAPQRGGRARPDPGRPPGPAGPLGADPLQRPDGRRHGPRRRAARLRPRCTSTRAGPADGVDLLAPADVEAMQRPHVERRSRARPRRSGWTVRRWGDHDLPGPGRRHVRPAGRPAGGARRGGSRSCVHGQQPPRRRAGPELLGRLAADLLDVTAPDPGDRRGGRRRRSTAADLAAMRASTTACTSGSR